MNNIMDVHKLSINLDINRYIEYTLMYIGYKCVGYECVRPEKFQFLEKWQNRNFNYKIVISVKNPKFIL